MLKIYGRTTSSNVQKVLWCCGEIGLDFERIDIDAAFGGLKTPGYLALNPNGLMPTSTTTASSCGSRTSPSAISRRSTAMERCVRQTFAPRRLRAVDGLAADGVGDADGRRVSCAAARTARGDARGAVAGGGETRRRLWRMLDTRLADRAYVGGDALTMGDIALGNAIHRWYDCPPSAPSFHACDNGTTGCASVRLTASTSRRSEATAWRSAQLAVDPEDAADVADVDSEITGRRVVEAQYLRLPPAWRRADRFVIEGTHVALFAIGMVFTLMIALEVVSRYVFSFSISFVNAFARLLLVWFFLLGAGIALRRGAHVGFELLLSKMKAGARKAFILFGFALAAIFYLQLSGVAGMRSDPPGRRRRRDSTSASCGSSQRFRSAARCCSITPSCSCGSR